MTETTQEQEITRLRRVVGEAPHDIEAVLDLAHALLDHLHPDADLSVVDEPMALLHTALELTGADPDPLDRVPMDADLADLYAWRCRTAARRSAATDGDVTDSDVTDGVIADRDAAIEHWRRAALVAEEAGRLAELVAGSPLTVLDQVDLLVARAMDAGEGGDLDDAIELAGLLVEVLPDDDPDRDDALFAHAVARALRFDTRTARQEDLHAAIRDLRELWQGITEEHPLYADTAAWLGLALASRVRHDDPEIATHVAEAVAQLKIAARFPAGPDAPAHRVVRLHLGALLAVRYLYLARGTESRDAAVAVLREVLETPGVDELAADVCHLGLALLTLAGAAPGARRWGLAPGERALDRLRTEADDPARDEARRHLASLTKHARASLLPAIAEPSDDPEEIADSVTLFGEGHPLRGVLLTLLGTTAHSPEVGAEKLALLERALRHLPDDSRWRDPVLSVLATASGDAIVNGDRATVDGLRALLTEVVARPAADAANDAVNHFLLALVTTARGLAHHDAELLTEATRHMRDTAELAPTGHWTIHLAEGMLSSLLGLTWIAGSEREYLDASLYHAGGRAAAGTPGPLSGRAEALTTSVLAQISTGYSRASAELLSRTIAELDKESTREPAGHPNLSNAAFLADLARFYQAGREHGFYSAAGRTGATRLARAAEAAVERDDRDPYAVIALSQARLASAFARRDIGEIDKALADLAAASTSSSFAPRERATVLSTLGLSFCVRYELTRQVRDLSLGIDRMEEAARLFREHPGGVFAPINTNALAKAYHTRADKALGDRARAAVTGLESLRNRAADVRLQTGTQRAMDAASTAAKEAVEVFRWCLAAAQPDSAVTALELGRAMVVRVATSDPSVPAALRASGADDLAEEWETSTSDTAEPWDAPHLDLLLGTSPELFAGFDAKPVPNDLRRRALRVIGADEEPPTTAEIAVALEHGGTNALVYLLPPDGYGPGTALLVGQDEKITTVSLPELDTSADTRLAEVHRVHEELARLDAHTPEWSRLRERGTRLLGEMCDWAWTSVMAKVTDAVAAYPARVVIVPVGGLAVVPWHAARRIVGDGVLRYACQDAIISYAASARQFVDASRRATPTWQSAPGLVRVPESTLYWATREIEGIRDRYYPDATYLGGSGRRRRQDHRPATPDNVRALLPGPGSPGASVVHLGCHAHLADPPIRSYLSLQDGQLQVGDILDQARQRPLDAPGGLVVLAACTSDASEAIHDESLSLATAFLAAGASGVVGARWAVDDVPTAAFMTMFHHYLNSGYADPAKALRATQLWMLNPHRRIPAGFDRVLADELTQLDLTEVMDWGAFTYQGR